MVVKDWNLKISCEKKLMNLADEDKKLSFSKDKRIYLKTHIVWLFL